jgi:hypothetical protein
MSSSGLALALRLLEANKLSVTHDALFETFGSAVAELVEKGFWLRTGSANEATIHDDDGQPTNVDWDEDRREFGYYKAAEGWTPIDPARLDCYEPDIDRLLDCLLDRKLRKPVGGIFKVDDQGFAWEVGTLRLTRRGPTSVWFVRCLRDLVAASEITAAAAARPASGLRLLLTSSSRAAAQSIRIPSATIVSIADILSTDDHPRIDMATLKARLMGSTAEPVTEPVHLADDGSVLTLLGQIELPRVDASRRYPVHGVRTPQGKPGPGGRCPVRRGVQCGSTRQAVPVAMADTQAILQIQKRALGLRSLMTVFRYEQRCRRR